MKLSKLKCLPGETCVPIFRRVVVAAALTLFPGEKVDR